MIRYHTYKTIGKMNNQINAVSPKKWGYFVTVIDGLGGYIDNVLSNVILCWSER